MLIAGKGRRLLGPSRVPNLSKLEVYKRGQEFLNGKVLEDTNDT